MRQINQGRDVEHDFLVFPFRGDCVKASIGAKTSIIHQQINRNTQFLRPPVDLLRSAFAAEVSRDDFGTNAVLFREFLRQRAQFVCRACHQYQVHAARRQDMCKCLTNARRGACDQGGLSRIVEHTLLLLPFHNTTQTFPVWSVMHGHHRDITKAGITLTESSHHTQNLTPCLFLRGSPNFT